MTDRKFILNADDFGMTNDFNRAVLYAYGRGLLKSTSLCANGPAFDNAVNEILPECSTLGIGVHLNIMEGHALTKCHLLTDDSGMFNQGYLSLIFKAKNKNVQKQIESEFRAQIEKIISITKPDHIDSHVHTHAIPEIFKIVVKLAKEYNIPYIRTQHEAFYTVPKLSKHLNFKYPINILKIFKSPVGPVSYVSSKVVISMPAGFVPGDTGFLAVAHRRPSYSSLTARRASA